MRAFIEYPDVSDDRIEIKSEFVVETRAHRYADTLSKVVSRNKMDIVVTEPVFIDHTDQYWKDEC